MCLSQARRNKVFWNFKRIHETACYHVTSSSLQVWIALVIKTLYIFLSALAKFREATLSFVMSVCPSLRPYGATRLQLVVFSWNFIWDFFRKYVQKIEVSLKSDNNNEYFTWRPMYIFNNISLSSPCNEKSFRQKVVEKIKTHILLSISSGIFFPPSKIVPFVR